MKFVSKPVEVEAEEIVTVEPLEEHNTYKVFTTTGGVFTTVTSNQVYPGDFINITNPGDICHTPRSFFVGSSAKYLELAKVRYPVPNILMRFFAYKHLPEKLQVVSCPIGELATKMDTSLPYCTEKGTGLRKLLEAKDCFVRAALEVQA